MRRIYNAFARIYSLGLVIRAAFILICCVAFGIIHWFLLLPLHLTFYSTPLIAIFILGIIFIPNKITKGVEKKRQNAAVKKAMAVRKTQFPAQN
jgi:membrane protein YdbS with pleckstrin-like domain